MRTTSSIAALALLLFFAACKPGPSPRVEADAAAPPSIDAARVEPREPIVSLLHTVEATVATSSRVENAVDHPEHLVDGKQETAWNGRTGDLKGWIAFRVPAAARVTRVELTVGFDKKTETGDHFTMNHRIRRVRLSRQGVSLAEVTLDVEKRAVQGIDVDAPGGDFRLEVLETISGTKREWRELTVSEFRVWGRAGGAPLNPSRLPKLAVGSLDGVPAPKKLSPSIVPRGPFASIAELCAAIDRAVSPLLRAKWGEDAFPASSGGRCEKGDQYGFEPGMWSGGPFEDAALIDHDDVEESHTALAVKTARGWYRTEVRIRSRHHMDPGCLRAVRHRVEDGEIATTTTGQKVAILTTVERETQWANPQASENASVWTERAFACRLDQSQAPSCEGPKRLATAKSPNPPDFSFDDERFFAVDLGAIPWQSRRRATLGPAGDLRAE